MLLGKKNTTIFFFSYFSITNCNNRNQLVEGQRKYGAASSQAINRGKTTLFFSKNTRADVKLDIQAMMRVQIMMDCEQYLGLPMVTGKSQVNTFKGVREKIAKRVMRWRGKFISKVGQEILIKTVVQAIPTYTMSIFKIPMNLCNDINCFLAKY